MNCAPHRIVVLLAVAGLAGGCARPPAPASALHGPGGGPGDATSTTELTSATAGGPSAPRVGKPQRSRGDAGVTETLTPARETAGDAAADEATDGEARAPRGEKRPEREDTRRRGFGEWK